MANTPNLGLHQWSAGDSFLRTDFNEDFGKIDTVVGEKCQMAWGTYDGSMVGGNGANSKMISVPFAPKVVLVYWQATTSTGNQPTTSSHFGMAVEGMPLMGGSYAILRISGNGFEVGSPRIPSSVYMPSLNENGKTYIYLAIR